MGIPTEPELPVELTHAAFRFGHSRKWKSYRINDEKEATLRELFQMSADRNPDFPGLSDEFVVDWSRQFSGLGKDEERDFAK